MYYCEYLPRLKEISIALDYDGESVEEISNIKLMAPSTLKVVTRTLTLSILLPHVFEHAGFALKRLSLDQTHTLRISISENYSGTIDTDKNVCPLVHQSFVDKWLCKDLQQKTPNIDGINQFTFVCRQCKSVLIDSKSRKFKDLPSEYWYELMDFWHCQKPNRSDDVYNNSYEGHLVPQEDNMVLLGTYYLVFLANPSIRIEECAAKCKNCNSNLGQYQQNALTIYKWNLSLQHCHLGQDVQDNYDKQMYIYRVLADKINSLATRKFNITCDEKTLCIWVINLDIAVSINGKCHAKCIKLAYFIRKQSSIGNDVLRYESISLEGNSANELLELLEAINSEFPRSISLTEMHGQKFKVSILSQEPI